MKYLLLIIAWLLCLAAAVACDGRSSTSASTPDAEYERQVKETARQLELSGKQQEETQRQLDRYVKQGDRYDELLQRWEHQADRFDRILDSWERREQQQQQPPDGR